MLAKGTRVRIREDLTYDETNIFETYLAPLRGKETTIVCGTDAYTLAISEMFLFDESWLEVIENSRTGVLPLDEMEKLFKEQENVSSIFKKLRETQSISDVSDIVDSMDESTAKLVLKKFVYSRGQ